MNYLKKNTIDNNNNNINFSNPVNDDNINSNNYSNEINNNNINFSNSVNDDNINLNNYSNEINSFFNFFINPLKNTIVNLKNELKKKEEKIEELDKKCSICFENKSNIIFIPCGHLCICNVCNERYIQNNISFCPICRINGSRYVVYQV
jgi:rubrerythrin